MSDRQAIKEGVLAALTEAGVTVTPRREADQRALDAATDSLLESERRHREAMDIGALHRRRPLNGSPRR